MDHTAQTFGRRFDHKQNANRFVYRNHLPWQAGSKVACVAVHHTDYAGHIVGKFRAATIAVVIDKGKVVFETDARAHRDDRGHQRERLRSSAS